MPFWEDVSERFPKQFYAAFWGGLVGSASAGEDFWRGTKTTRTRKNWAGASKDMTPRVGPRVGPRTWQEPGHGDLARRPRRGGGYARGASHQPDPAADARSDERTSEEADGTRVSSALEIFGASWGQLVPSAALGPRFLSLGGSFWNNFSSL